LNFGGENPLNIRSNLTAFGGLDKSPTQLAIDDALVQLKAGPSDSVLLVGHSQGALVGAQIATSDQPYQVAGLISFGGPISQFGLEVPVISLQNHGDPVPHLSGQVNPMAANWVTASNPGEYASVIDAHKMASYVESAKELDQSSDAGFRRIHDQLGIQPDKPGMRYVFELSRD
jgi:pimeloyl-ACP methyl ester carboxylesterase